MQQSRDSVPCTSTAAQQLQVFAGKVEHQVGPNISRLAPQLQQEWDTDANAHLGSITITPESGTKAW